MATTYTTNLGLPKQGTGDNPNTWGTTLNGGLDTVDSSFGGTTSLTLSNSAVNLTQTQSAVKRFYLTGTLLAGVTITIPVNVGGEWIVDNQTSGAYTVTIASGGGGATTTATQGQRGIIFSDGTNVYSIGGAVSGVSGNGLALSSGVISRDPLYDELSVIWFR